MTKLYQLANDFGFSDPLNMVSHYLFEGVMPGICINPGCNFSTEYEPDQAHGWCEECQTNTVVSAEILMF